MLSGKWEMYENLKHIAFLQIVNCTSVALNWIFGTVYRGTLNAGKSNVDFIIQVNIVLIVIIR